MTPWQILAMVIASAGPLLLPPPAMPQAAGRDTPIQGAQALEPLFSARPAQMDSGRAQIEIAARSVAVYEVR